MIHWESKQPRKCLLQENVMLTTCPLQFLHQEKNPGYFMTKTVCLKGESFQKPRQFFDTPLSQCGNLKPGILPPSHTTSHPRPWSCASTPSNLETHSGDLWHNLHKIQSGSYLDVLNKKTYCICQWIGHQKKRQRCKLGTVRWSNVPG